MKINIKIPVVFLIIGLFYNGFIFSDEISLATTNWGPYADETLLNNGFTSEIIRKAFERSGYTVSFHFLPWKRAANDVENGHYDALYSAYYSEERADIYALSEPYAESTLILCSLKEKDIIYNNLQDLIPYTIGTVRGYVNTPEFDNADYLTKEEVTSDLLNIHKLIFGRIDLIVIDQYVAIHNIKISPTLPISISDVKFIYPPLEKKQLYIMFSKAVDGYEKKLTDFNYGLNEIRKDGTYNEILLKYGFIIE